MAPLRAFLSVAVIATVLFESAMGANITVGAPNGGWDESTDFKTWASSQKFSTGDTLIFRYTPNHDVLEVSKADYDGCVASSPIKSYAGGNTAVVLTAAGKRYFICGTPGHCGQGMKVEVDVSAATATPPPAAAPATPPPKSAPSPASPRKSPPTASPPPKKAPSSSPSPSTPPTSAGPSGSPPSTPPTSAGPSGSPPGTPPTSAGPSGSTTPPHAPSAAIGLKTSVAAGFAAGLMMVLAL